MFAASPELPTPDQTTNQVVHLYTDGACINNPGPGGWAFSLHYMVNDVSKAVKESSGFQANTTNNQMELSAIIHGLSAIKPDCRLPIWIFTDSQYACKGMTEWRQLWQRRQWENVKNVALWQQLIKLSDKFNTHYQWVRGHSGVSLNERVDQLAKAAALGKTL